MARRHFMHQIKQAILFFCSLKFLCIDLQIHKTFSCFQLSHCTSKNIFLKQCLQNQQLSEQCCELYERNLKYIPNSLSVLLVIVNTSRVTLKAPISIICIESYSFSSPFTLSQKCNKKCTQKTVFTVSLGKDLSSNGLT